MKNIYKNFIEQLDELVGFLSLANKRNYDFFENEPIIVPTTGIVLYDRFGNLFSNNYNLYENHLCISAFILGYTHFEAFLNDLMLKCLLRKPELLLPTSKSQNNEKVVAYKKILEHDSKDSLIKNLAEKEVRNKLYDKISQTIIYFNKRLKLKWEGEFSEQIILANKIRNCCMHNNGIADNSLDGIENFKRNEKIVLSVHRVNNFGFVARDLSKSLWEQGVDIYSIT